jgi:hypothetical protein
MSHILALMTSTTKTAWYWSEFAVWPASQPDSGFADAGKWLGRGLFDVLPKVLIPP